MASVDIFDCDATGQAPTSFASILDALGERALRARWKVDGIDCVGVTSDRFFDALVDREFIDGRALREASLAVDQFIEGSFVAFVHECTTPWLTIEAIDGTSWGVDTDDATALDALRRRFAKVVDGPE